ncbi:hypothetical protein ACW7EJ_10100, partial [Acinetobacter soli]
FHAKPAIFVRLRAAKGSIAYMTGSLPLIIKKGRGYDMRAGCVATVDKKLSAVFFFVRPGTARFSGGKQGAESLNAAGSTFAYYFHRSLAVPLVGPRIHPSFRILAPFL